MVGRYTGIDASIETNCEMVLVDGVFFLLFHNNNVSAEMHKMMPLL